MSSVLVFEPRSEGHHVPWAALITKTLVDAGRRTILAHGPDADQLARIEATQPGVLDSVVRHPIAPDRRPTGRSALEALARAVETHRPDRILVANLDEFAPSTFRRACLGHRLPPAVRGRLRGIYIRPRPLDPGQGGLRVALMRMGLERLARRGEIERLGVLDENLVASGPRFGIPLEWIPDFWTPAPEIERDEARRRLGVPDDATALLFFGVPHRRKGLDLVATAMTNRAPDRAFLLVAGRQRDDPKLRRALAGLEEQGRAVVHDRYLSDHEMAEAFEACDRVLLPYRAHYGSSGVLSQAAAHGRPVVASDHHLLGRRVREGGLGVLHRDGDAESLSHAIGESVDAEPGVEAAWRRGLDRWRARTTQAAFGEAILRLVD